MKFQFQMKYETNYGQNLYVCGSVAELGNWVPKKAKRMQYVSNGIWNLIIELNVPKGQQLTYKYCILDDRYLNGGIPFWEPSLDHQITVPEDEIKEIECFDLWGVSWKTSSRNLSLT